MKTQQIFHAPKNDDLFIPGMLLDLKVHYNSFSVRFQFEGADKFAGQLAVFERIFPIACLVQFFKVNGAVDKNYFVRRPKEYLKV